MSIQAKSLTLTIDNVSKIIAVTNPDSIDTTQVVSIKIDMSKPIVLTLQYTQAFDGRIAHVHSVSCKDNDYMIKISSELLNKMITKVDCEDGTTYSLNNFLGIR